MGMCFFYDEKKIYMIGMLTVKMIHHLSHARIENVRVKSSQP